MEAEKGQSKNILQIRKKYSEPLFRRIAFEKVVKLRKKFQILV